MQTSFSNGELLVEVRNQIAHLTLNRPQALNSLTHDMIQALSKLFTAWAIDDGVQAIIVRGAGDKAFCAGGDIRALYDTARRHDGSLFEFFREEYELDFAIHRFLANTHKPYIAWIDGIVMGGGMGISQGAVLRIVGGRTKMAMPETSIGMFPDVGGSYFLSRCPGATGLYLGLTGQTLRAADALYTGLATHHIASESAFEFDYALDTLVDWHLGTLVAMREIVQKFSSKPIEAATLPPRRDAIDRHFAGKASVAAIVASLQGETDPHHREWAQQTVATLAKKSPLMLEVTRRQLELAERMSLAECFRMELNLVMATFEHKDVVEGIRALLIDKDQKPVWNPASLAEVKPEQINEFFRPRWDNASHPLAHMHIGATR